MFAIDFYDILLSKMYTYQQVGPMFLRGDLNSCCGAATDYIEGLNDIQERNVVDLDMARYGDCLFQFFY